ncbi:hypothetical protein [Natrinema sp. 74]|uniref:hypothetical protein n=1 Tax=Natrinema sp. 74 TaxID=3384159 RepID=UPI0038D38517
MRPARPTRLVRLAAIALCCSLVGVAAVTAVVAAPPPAPVCGVCGSSVENVSVSGATGSGTLDIYVDETGDSLWHARVPVTESAAERYRTNATALKAAVERAWPRYHVADGDIRTVETALEDGTVVVNYTVDDIARRGVGESWVVDYFHEKDLATNYDQQARRVTLHTPDGTVVTNRPTDASVDGNAATWTRDSTGASDRDFDEAVYVTYGEDSLLGTASGHATIALTVGPPALRQGLIAGTGPGLLIGIVGVGIGRFVAGGRADVDTAALERAIAVIGVVGGLGFVLVGTLTSAQRVPPGVVTLAMLGFGYASLGSAARRVGGRLETGGLTGLAVLATIVTGGVTVALAGPPIYASPLLFGLATALFLPIGYAIERGRTPVVPLAIGAITPIAAATMAFPVSRLLHRFYVPLAVLQLLSWVAVVAVFGFPLALLGRELASEGG